MQFGDYAIYNAGKKKVGALNISLLFKMFLIQLNVSHEHRKLGFKKTITKFNKYRWL